MKKLLVFMAVALFAVASSFAQGTSESKTPETKKAEPMKVGVIYVSAPGDFGYSYMHDQGTKAAEAKFGDKIKVIRMENVPENEESERAMENLIDAGCKIIFANSYNYQQYMLNVAKDHPDVYFEHCSGYLSNANMSNYFGRMYQMRYLSGMIAGKMSESGQIGYVAAFNTPEVVRGINAFTLGARVENPNATVRVVWTNTWFDPSKERQGAESLLDAGCDVIAQHQDTTEPAKAAIERGDYSIGYNADFRAITKSDNVLVSPMWNWGNYMIPEIQDALDGTWTMKQYWGGLDDNMIKLSDFSPLVPATLVTEIQGIEAKMRADTFDVFWGKLTDNEGNIKQAAGAKMSDSDMLSINWFVEGVAGSVN
ncbi:MAG: BMP family ABC transporter substrate-binding protein [Spirochaetaceae bacterium]|nr:BMP family ABC transporter substrate-binding protein [Spirochaetaceae bacterium]